MKVKYEKLMLKLWRIAGEIGELGENDIRYSLVYNEVSKALDVAEKVELITYKEEK